MFSVYTKHKFHRMMPVIRAFVYVKVSGIQLLSPEVLWPHR